MAAPRARPVRPHRAGARLLGWPVGLSLGVHAAGLATAATVAALTPHAPPPSPATSIEIVRLDPPPAPAPKPQAAPKRVAPQPKPEPEEKIVAPRLVTQPTELAPPDPLPPATLLDDAPRKAPVPASAATSSSDTSRRFLAGASASSSWSLPGTPRSGAAGPLLATGDLPVAGGSGPLRDVASTGTGAKDASGDTAGLTSLARPLGGYQTRPRYPDSARREGIEGEALLRFQVLSTGRVASVSVARSAGHPDLDRAAIEAVTTWLFEPARRGKDAVSVWVTLPVRFQLDGRGGL
jgi:periplasmic protein TonB